MYRYCRKFGILESGQNAANGQNLASVQKSAILSAMAFDSLRFARRLRDAGVPEPQADAHAELMAETLSHFAENMLTKSHFEAVLDARFAAQDARIEQRFSKQDRTLVLHTWMLGLLVLVMVVPQLQDWLA